MAGADLRKAAVLLMSLPPRQCAQLFARLPAEQIEAVSAEIASISALDSPEQDSVIQEFAQYGSQNNPKTFLRVDHGITRLAGQKRDNGLPYSRPEQREARPLAFLERLDSGAILSLIVSEHPQTIALVISYLPSALAIQVLARLSSEQQSPVVRRLATMVEPDPEIVADLASALHSRMSTIGV